jgi:hypothetical protein
VKNIKGENIYYSTQKFIYDISNYGIISQNTSLTTEYSYSTYVNLNDKLPILLFTPTDFDPYLYNLNKNDFDYTTLSLLTTNYDSSHNSLIDLSRQLIFYKGCFRSPKNFISIFGNNSDNYGFKSAIFSNYKNQSQEVLSTSLDIVDDGFTNKYKWQIYRYNVKISENISGSHSYLICSLEDTNITLKNMGKDTTTHPGITTASNVEIWFKIEYVVKNKKSNWIKLSGFSQGNPSQYKITSTNFDNNIIGYVWNVSTFNVDEDNAGWESGNLDKGFLPNEINYKDGISRKIVIGQPGGNFPDFLKDEQLRIYFCVGMRNGSDVYLGKIKIHKFV